MTRTRRIVLWTALGAFLLGGAATLLPPFISEGHADHARVISIKESRDYQDPALLKKAWALPVAAAYQADIESQQNGSVCGPTSLANVLHSYKRLGTQQSILQGSGFSTVMGYLPQGLTLDQLAEIARQKLQRKVTVLRDLDLAAFREQLSHVNDPARRYVLNFSRGPLFGTGGGHHSPLAAYLAQEDLVLVLDVNKKYGPWLVKSDRLFEAMNTLDATAQKKRGLLLIE
jgi:hypothetical protein